MATPLTAATAAATGTTKPKSNEAARLLRDLMDAPLPKRRKFQATLNHKEWEYLLRESETEFGSLYGMWQDDPVGFVTFVLDESLWSRSRQLMESIPKNIRTAVPSCFSSSKSFSASRVALWWSMVYPPSTVKVVTIAPKWSQVEGIIWPEIRKAHSRSGMPGTVDMTQLKIPYNGIEYRVAYGISASPTSESSVHGLHAPNFLLIVDEAGGVGPIIGDALRGLLTGDNSR